MDLNSPPGTENQMTQDPNDAVPYGIQGKSTYTTITTMAPTRTSPTVTPILALTTTITPTTTIHQTTTTRDLQI
ncbi:hypothetical protein Pst134EB_023987 [Puccinia striiformis f. sp. tritici]|nr:hypothetical protein Pst134EB_023987 [Puccinia striiformis f. sp. tritici]